MRNDVTSARTLLVGYRRGRAVVQAALLVVAVGCGGAAESGSERPAVSLPGGTLSADALSSIGPRVQSLIDEGRVPGAVTVVIHRGEVVHFEARGFADVEARVPMTEDTIFRWYSMSKPITCAAVMLLVEEGRIGLDDPIAAHLPEFEAMNVRTEDGLVPARSPITVRHLLTHTAGLTYGVLNSPVAADYRTAAVSGPEDRLAGRSLAEHVRVLATLPLVAEPGTRWSYGESMGVLGRLVEVVSGDTLGHFLAERLFRPLGMKDTAFFVSAERADRLAALYVGSAVGSIVRAPDGAFGGDYRQKPQLEYGGAGLAGTATDYLRFAALLANGGSVDGVRILMPESVELMMANHLPAGFPATPLDSLRDINPWLGERGLGFGFGGYVVVDPGAGNQHYSVGEYSWGGWARTNFWVDPKENLIGLIMTQVIPGERPPETREILREAVYGALDRRS